MKWLGKIFRPWVLILCVLSISFSLVQNSTIGTSKIVDSEFLFTLLGVILGFALTLLTFIVSMLDKVKEQINANLEMEEKLKIKRLQTVKDLYRELRQNIKFIFATFVLVGTMVVLDKTDIPFFRVKDFIDSSKSEILNSIKLAIIALNMYAIYDLLSVTFTVSEATGIYAPPIKKP